MSDGADFSLEEMDGGGTRLVLSGPYLVSTIGEIERDLRDLDDDITQIDLSAVHPIDTVGAWITCRIADDHGAEITGADGRAQRLIDAVESMAFAEDGAEDAQPLWTWLPEQAGRLTRNAGWGIMGVVGFLGQILQATGGLIAHPSRFRGKALSPWA